MMYGQQAMQVCLLTGEHFEYVDDYDYGDTHSAIKKFMQNIDQDLLFSKLQGSTTLMFT